LLENCGMMRRPWCSCNRSLRLKLLTAITNRNARLSSSALGSLKA